MASSEIILGIDPSLRGTGYGVLEILPKGGYRVLAHGSVRIQQSVPLTGALLGIFEKIEGLIAEHRPTVAAVEQTIYVQSRQTAITLGCARGVVLLALARAGLPIHDYAPREIKSATTGRGGADKGQVAFMIRALLGMEATPNPDAADALAAALTHANRIKFRAAAPKSLPRGRESGKSKA